MTGAQTATDAREPVAVQVGRHGLMVGTDDGALAHIDSLEDRLQVDGAWIKSDVAVEVRQ